MITFDDFNRKCDQQRFSERFRSTAFSINFFSFRKTSFKNVDFTALIDQFTRSFLDIQNNNQTFDEFLNVIDSRKSRRKSFESFIIENDIDDNDQKNDDTQNLSIEDLRHITF